MIWRQIFLQSLVMLVVLAACAVRQASRSDRCHALSAEVAAGAALQDCLDALPAGSTLALPPIRIVLTQPLVLRHRVTLTTAGAGASSCDAGCATLVLRLMAPFSPMQHAVTVAGSGSILDHLIIEGGKADAARNDTKACNGPGRPAMGGLAVTASNVAIINSVVRDVACYSAVVVDPGADGFRFEGNAVLSNGAHDKHGMWADGLTLIDGVNAVVRGNLFRDNTDVQLVMGGCLRCTVTDNRLEETSAPGAGAFAGLLVHGWPHTSGDYAGTVVMRNTIDCGPAHACGFGLGIGGRGWYDAPTSGGLIADNSVSRAKIGINVDGATGPVTMRDNRVTESGGAVASHCGEWLVGPVNIAPGSRPFVDATAGAAMAAEAVTSRSFDGCLPGT